MSGIIPPDELKRRAAAIGLTPTRLAALAGVAPSTVSRLVRGETCGHFRTLLKLSAVIAEREQARARRYRKEQAA